MIPQNVQEHIRESLESVIGKPPGRFELIPVSGGSINLTYQLQLDSGEQFFCKINSVSRYPALFQKEKNGLMLLAAENIIRVPQVVFCSIKGDYQVLVLEWIEQGLPDDEFWKLFGIQLAQLHRLSSVAFGLNEDNYMGALPQSNQYTAEWVDFFIAHRLIPQVKLAMDKRLIDAKLTRLFEGLYVRLPAIFEKEPPSLLHGDLWNGNFMCDANNKPVLIDPAVYFGHRSMDLGMTTLFGGFAKEFYRSYQENFTLPKNHEQQWEICNLYPLLIHLNLFGSSYLSGIMHTLRHY
jgi:protein-ribulosamine 3-kinase